MIFFFLGIAPPDAAGTAADLLSSMVASCSVGTGEDASVETSATEGFTFGIAPPDWEKVSVEAT